MTRMRMRSTNLKILKALLTADMILILASVIFFDIKMLYNIQIGFISSALILFASMTSYLRMVDARVEHEIIIDDSKDVIDKVEDPFDLYSKEIVESEEEERTLSEVVKEEKKKLKSSKRGVTQTLKDTTAALSLYRLGAYAILILGFMYLNRHGLLHIPSFIFALSVPIVITVAILIGNKEKQIQDKVK